jgi:single-stranded DNA-binding protein
MLHSEKQRTTSLNSTGLDGGNPVATEPVGEVFFLDIPFYRTEWHRVIAWNSLGERVAASLHQGDHILVEGTLVSSTYEREYGKGKKATTVKHTVWQIRADSIRKLNRGEKEPEAIASGSASAQPSTLTQSEGAPF